MQTESHQVKILFAKLHGCARPPSTCQWCNSPLEGRRSDTKYCKKACRQAAWRARIAGCQERQATQPMRLAYADPPYPGKSSLYRGSSTYAGEVDIPALLQRLAAYDGWALSTSSAALPQVLAECVTRRLTVRVAAWCRRPRPHKTARILNGWEPVVFAGGRRILPPQYPPDTSTVDVRMEANRIAGDDRPLSQGSPSTGPTRPLQVTDTLIGINSRRRPTLPGNCIGMKPPLFCEWIFKLLGALPGDSLDDLFPGSGIVTRAWMDYTGQASSGSRDDP